MNKTSSLLIIVLILLFASCKQTHQIGYVGPSDADLIINLTSDNVKVHFFESFKDALNGTSEGGSILYLSDGNSVNKLSIDDIDLIAKKDIKVYVEFSDISSLKPFAIDTVFLERVVVMDDVFFDDIEKMSLLTINSNPIIRSQSDDVLLGTAKVAGFDKAVYGLENTDVLPLLFHYNDNILVSTSPLSNYATSRFMPEHDWQKVWESILSYITRDDFNFKSWLSYVSPSYDRDDILEDNARYQSVKKGIEWFYNGHFIVDESWKEDWLDKYMGDGLMPIGPELPRDLKDGTGSLGVLEGHCSYIYPDGLQKYRYWLRNDVQGESAMAFAVAGSLMNNPDYMDIASNLIDFSFDYFRKGPRDNPDSSTYGLLGWSATHQWVYYGDDNARSILGMAAASALLKEDRWNKKIIETVIGNYRTSGKNGFRQERLEEEDIQKNGWEYYFNREIINPHPHFESWLWAVYLWMYNQTGYEPLYEKARAGIEITMDAYPLEWKWTNGIQQERARMLLPLAWLLRVNPSEQHKEWLYTMLDDVLANQVESGAIREELGDATLGLFGRPGSNSDYGNTEAPLIFQNGDPIADMLYTSNFAFIGLNEAAKVLSDEKYYDALYKMSDFMTRIQVKSDRYKSVDGAWFRAFNFDNWDYWASNADAGWGAWSTLTGWIQSWILSTQSFIEEDISLWDILITLEVSENEFNSVIDKMLFNK